MTRSDVFRAGDVLNGYRLLEDFRVVASQEGLYRFTWDRHAGPCGEHYSIVLRENSDSKIAEISGRVRMVCL